MTATWQFPYPAAAKLSCSLQYALFASDCVPCPKKQRAVSPSSYFAVLLYNALTASSISAASERRGAPANTFSKRCSCLFKVCISSVYLCPCSRYNGCTITFVTPFRAACSSIFSRSPQLLPVQTLLTRQAGKALLTALSITSISGSAPSRPLSPIPVNRISGFFLSLP